MGKSGRMETEGVALPGVGSDRVGVGALAECSPLVNLMGCQAATGWKLQWG